MASNLGPLRGTCSRTVICATDFAEPQPPAGPLYGSVVGERVSDFMSVSSCRGGNATPPKRARWLFIRFSRQIELGICQLVPPDDTDGAWTAAAPPTPRTEPPSVPRIFVNLWG